MEMHLGYYTTVMLLMFVFKSTLFCQNFNISKTGTQSFYFKDPQNRNQASFTSNAPFENFTGVATDVWGEISFDPNDVKNTITGEIFISVNSIQTGIELRDEDLKGDGWLNSEKYPTISFKLEKANQVISLDNNKIRVLMDGYFNCRGKVKVITVDAVLTYLAESELTKKRISGDLLSVVSNFDINLSDYGIKSVFIPNRVSDKIEVSVNILGTNVNTD